MELPSIGLGTLDSFGESNLLVGAIKEAFKVGYRGLDTAPIYRNEHQIGQGLAQVFEENPGLKREDVFITSKLWNDDHEKDRVKPGTLCTLKDLGLSYLDLWLIHWPVSYKAASLVDPNIDPKSRAKQLHGEIIKVPIKETWQALEELVDQGLVRYIGVSNFDIPLLQEVLSFARIKPYANEVEMHPYLPQEDLLQFCKANGIKVIAYSPLGKAGVQGYKAADSPDLMTEPLILEIAKKYNKTPAQICLRWQVERGVHIIPKSTTPSRIAENFQVNDFKLEAEDVKAIGSLNKHYRFVSPPFMTFADKK